MKFYGELLVFVLLFITNLRVFFVHHVRRDPLVVLAPFTFIVAIFQILAWGIDAFTTLGLLIALFVLLSNFHAIFRYMEQLYVYNDPQFLDGRQPISARLNSKQRKRRF